MNTFSVQVRRVVLALGATSAIGALACVAPTTQLGSVSPAVVKAEQLKQRQLVIQSDIAEQQRLRSIAHPLLKAALPLCGKWVTTRLGVTVINIHAYPREYQEAARALGFSDTLTIVVVATGSAAERANLKVGDRLIGAEGGPAPYGPTASADFSSWVTAKPPRRGEPALASKAYRFVVRRANSPSAYRDLPIDVQSDTICAYGAVALKNAALNAWADGQQIVLTTAMMRFASTDDELAVIVAHEIAHNAMRHIDAKKTNAGFGAILGAIVDVAAASQGVNTGGDFAKQGAAIGAMTYSQDFEREADYVGLYILARSGRPFATSPDFWRRMAQETPGSIKYASTHPTSAERFVRLEKTVAEIQLKQSSGLALLPDPKRP